MFPRDLCQLIVQFASYTAEEQHVRDRILYWLYAPTIQFGEFADEEGYIEAEYPLTIGYDETEWTVVRAWVDRVRLFTPHERRYILNFSITKNTKLSYENHKVENPQEMTVDSYFTFLSNSIDLNKIDMWGPSERIADWHLAWQNEVVAMLITSGAKPSGSPP